jgi:hypothetical protein
MWRSLGESNPCFSLEGNALLDFFLLLPFGTLFNELCGFPLRPFSFGQQQGVWAAALLEQASQKDLRGRSKAP